MIWKSIEQVALYFQFDDVKDDPERLRRAIKGKMKEVHPDPNGDKFENKSTKELWHQLQSAKEFVDEQAKSTQLIPISQIATLVESLSGSGSYPIEARVTNLKAEARVESRSRNLIPRIGSGVFAAISGFLFTFSSSAKDHPLLGELIGSTIVQVFLLVMAFYSSVFFMLTWRRENLLEEKVGFLSSEEGVRETLIKLLKSRKKQKQPRRFSLRDLTYEISGNRHGKSSPSSLLLGDGSISASTADKIAGVQVDRLLKRGLIVELPQNSLEREFEVSPAIRVFAAEESTEG